MKLNRLLTIFTVPLLTTADPFDPGSVSPWSPLTFYCPWDVTINLSTDGTVITIKYTAVGSRGQKNLVWEAQPEACFVQVPLLFRRDTWNSVSMVGIQYTARKLTGEAKAKAVWSYPAIGVSGVTSPVCDIVLFGRNLSEMMAVVEMHTQGHGSESPSQHL